MYHNGSTSIKDINKPSCLKFVKINHKLSEDDDLENNDPIIEMVPNLILNSARVEVIDEINFDEIVVENEFNNKYSDKVEHLHNIDKSFLVDNNSHNDCHGGDDYNVNLGHDNVHDRSSFMD